MLNAISRYGAAGHPQHDADHRGARAAAVSSSKARTSPPSRQAFAARLGGVRAVSTSYGRMAFFYILQALDLPPGGEIVFPALTFWVMPEMARVAGLTPVFADVDPVTFNITAGGIRARDHAAHGRGRADASVGTAVRHGRDPRRSRGAHGLRVIEDCAHALGATYRGRAVGTFGDAAIFSFQTLKPLNAYGGGMAVDARCGARRAASRRSREPNRRQTARRLKQRLWHGRVHADRHAPEHLHVDAVPVDLRVHAGCTGTSTCTSGSRSVRSIRCRADYRAAVSATCRRRSRSKGWRISTRGRRGRGSTPSG